MRKLRLCNDLGGAKWAISSNLRRSEANRGSAAAALNFQRICRDRRQLLGPKLEILFIRAFLNFRSTRGNRLAAPTVGAREAAVTGLENQIC